MMMLKLLDVNGKEFNMTLAQLTDMTTDMPTDMGSLNDNENVAVPHFDVQILDADGSRIDAIKLMDSVKDGSAKMPSAIDVTFEATHSGRNANYFQYDSADLERDAHTWMSPFPKPLIKNHDTFEEPLGRVKDYSFGPSELTDSADCINVTYRVTDADAIQKFLDKRYHTMSIGAKTSNIRCNICGKDILKDGQFKFCGHMRGENYAGQKAFWTAKDFEFKEGSIVNNPADKWAQVKKIQVVKDDATSVKDSEGDSVPTNVKPNAIQDNHDDMSLIDDVLENTNPQEGAEGQVQDNEQTNTDDVQDNEQGQEGAEAGALTDAEKLANMQSLIDSITAERDGLQTQVTDCENKIQALMDERAELEGRIEDAESASKDLRRQNARLAVLNKTFLVDRAMDFESRATKLTDEEKESRRAELTQMKATELSDLIHNHLEKESSSVRQTAAQVASPGLSDNSDNANIQDDETDSTSESTKPKASKTLKDLEDAAINLFTRNY